MNYGWIQLTYGQVQRLKLNKNFNDLYTKSLSQPNQPHEVPVGSKSITVSSEHVTEDNSWSAFSSFVAFPTSPFFWRGKGAIQPFKKCLNLEKSQHCAVKCLLLTGLFNKPNLQKSLSKLPSMIGLNKLVYQTVPNLTKTEDFKVRFQKVPISRKNSNDPNCVTKTVFSKRMGIFICQVIMKSGWSGHCVLYYAREKKVIEPNDGKIISNPTIFTLLHDMDIKCMTKAYAITKEPKFSIKRKRKKFKGSNL